MDPTSAALNDSLRSIQQIFEKKAGNPCIRRTEVRFRSAFTAVRTVSRRTRSRFLIANRHRHNSCRAHLCGSGSIVRLASITTDFLFGREKNLVIFFTEPFSNLLRIESDGSANVKAGNLTSRSHAINMLVVHSQDVGEIGDLDAPAPGFQLFDEIRPHSTAPKWKISAGAYDAQCCFQRPANRIFRPVVLFEQVFTKNEQSWRTEPFARV